MKNKYSVGQLIYDASIYDGMNNFIDDLDFYTRWLTKRKNAKILELCCGTGRLTIPLAKAGCDISGLDFTSTMLNKAKEKALNQRLDIPFIEGDMRTFELNTTYDYIFIPFNSIHHLYNNEDVFKMLSAVKKHLNDDGKFIFDCFNPNIKFISEGEKHLREISNYSTDDGRQVTIKEIMSYESASQINRIDWHYYINGAFNSIQKLDMRMFFPLELDEYIKRGGFKIVHKFGSFKEDPFSSVSEKQIFICQPQ
ncbi:class I SAM-dependent methyltransferase [Winogradskyella poriferorum]|uniref:class I SAM-dependent methyltransferase n=1 Tax=Winogradskyella poriferorum TaxID=307627 RepID=UPI003D65C23C